MFGEITQTTWLLPGVSPPYLSFSFFFPSLPLSFLPFPTTPSHSSPIPIPFLKRRPLKSSWDLRNAVSSPSGVWGIAQPKLNVVHFSLKVWHLVAAIFLRIKWRNFMQNFLILCRIYWFTGSWGSGPKTGGVRGCKILLPQYDSDLTKIPTRTGGIGD